MGSSQQRVGEGWGGGQGGEVQQEGPAGGPSRRPALVEHSEHGVGEGRQ